MAQAIIAQLAYDLAAIIQFTQRDTANWQLLHRKVALQGPLKGELFQHERDLLFSSPLTGHFLFGPLV